MQVCFIYANRAEFSSMLPFIDFFKKKNSVDVVNIENKLKNIDDDKNLHLVYKKSYEILAKKKYDFVLLLGDRRELPFLALSAFFLNIPIVHLAAGEIIPGIPGYDQYMRPITSILSKIQITFTKDGVKEVEKLFHGISVLNSNVFQTGNPVVNKKLVKHLKPILKEPYDLVLIHPQSYRRNNVKNDIKELERKLQDKKTIFISGNKDRNYDLIEEFFKKLKLNKKYFFYDTLPTKEYFSYVKYCDTFFTNSSSIPEIKSLNLKCLQIIGKRNQGRIEYELNENAPKLLHDILKNYVKSKEN
jgi:GDP/UDP-N,N'-diacetylbacillosamine 2-epimerase (hydrolysing)